MNFEFCFDFNTLNKVDSISSVVQRRKKPGSKAWRWAGGLIWLSMLLTVIHSLWKYVTWFSCDPQRNKLERCIALMSFRHIFVDLRWKSNFVHIKPPDHIPYAKNNYWIKLRAVWTFCASIHNANSEQGLRKATLYLCSCFLVS